MEDLIINAKEHKLLKKYQNELEGCYRVKICMPKVSKSNSDMVFISIKGDENSRDCVKNFLSEKMNFSKNKDYKNSILITLSDSEEDTSIEDDSVCVIDPSSSFKNASCSSDSYDDSICIIDSSISTDTSEVKQNVFKGKAKCSKKRKRSYWDNVKEKVRSTAVLSPEVSELCEVTSTTNDVATKKLDNSDESIIIINETHPRFDYPGDFIPLPNKKRRVAAFENMCNQQNNSDSVAKIVPFEVVRSLRPIVIDGSNVAIEHGRSSKCFSSQGIQLAIDFFLKRGHTQVTAFVPKFRRNCGVFRTFPTKDPEILDDLANKQLVVFTPSRRVNGKCIASYDDRFTVQLAATNNGIIVSNDNYRDLIDENESFKKAIEQRLLMFCFVGDVFMVPEDPLGRDGPKLLDYLSFPPDDKKE